MTPNGLVDGVWELGASLETRCGEARKEGYIYISVLLVVLTQERPWIENRQSNICMDIVGREIDDNEDKNGVIPFPDAEWEKAFHYAGGRL